MMKKLILIVAMVLVLMNFSSAGEFGNKHSNPLFWSFWSLSSLDTICQEHNMPKAGTISYWCPALDADGTSPMTFWISETYGGSAYQGSSRLINSMDNQLWHQGCLDMPDVSVTAGQTLWFCANRGSGGSGTYNFYQGSGTINSSSVFYLPSKTYPRYGNSVTDGRWYKNGVPINEGTPYVSAFIYSDSTGAGFPIRDQYGEPTKIITTSYDEFYFPYDYEQVLNISKIFKGGTGTEYWQMSIYNVTDGVLDELFTCNATDSFNGYNITYYYKWSCDIPNLNLTRGYYRYYLSCYETSAFTTYCDNSPTFIYNYVNNGLPFERREELIPIDLFDYPRYNWQGDETRERFFTLGIEDDFFRTECYDGFDNDLDGTYDYPNDPDCSSWADNSESGETNWLDDEFCLYDWDCDENHNCYPNQDLLDGFVSYDCGCVNNQCTNINTLYYPDSVVLVNGAPHYMRQFSSGDFAGLGQGMYNFSSGIVQFLDFYAEFDKDSLIRNNPVYAERDSMNWKCLIDFTASYLWTPRWIKPISGTETLVSWQNRSSVGDTAYNDLAVISEGCNLEWIQTNSATEFVSGAEVGAYIYTFNSADRSKVLRFQSNDGVNATPIFLDMNMTALDSFEDGFVATEYKSCTDSKKISYRDSTGNEIWSYSDSFRTYEDVLGTDNGVYAVWQDCSGGTNGRYVTKIAPNGSLVWEIQTSILFGTATAFIIEELNDNLVYISPKFYVSNAKSAIIAKEDGSEAIMTTGIVSSNNHLYFIETLDDEISSYENETIKAEDEADSFIAGNGGQLHIFQLFYGAEEETELPDGDDDGCDTTCTTWTNPYLLKENFDGNIHNCGWSVTENVCYTGKLVRESDDSYFSLFKLSDEITSEQNRYVTIAFDVKTSDIQPNGKIQMTIYDTDDNKFAQLLFGELGFIYNNNNGNIDLVFQNTSTTESITINMHIDFVDDDYDLWYDGVIIASGLGFTDSFLNIDTIGSFRLTSQVAGYELDNIQIFATDQNNVIVPFDGGTSTIIDPTKSMCGLFNLEETSCSTDSDCETDDCLSNGKCNRFDMTYCDENGHTRGNKCIISAITSCVLESTADIILDNFLLFLVFLVILIIFVYILYAFR